MGSGDQRQTVGMVEGFGDILSEGVPSPSGGYSPAPAVIWVRPQQVTHGPLEQRLAIRFDIRNDCMTKPLSLKTEHALNSTAAYT